MASLPNRELTEHEPFALIVGTQIQYSIHVAEQVQLHCIDQCQHFSRCSCQNHMQCICRADRLESKEFSSLCWPGDINIRPGTHTSITA
jgi:hypothetical protein